MGNDKKLIRPKRLFPGDRVGVAAPAGVVDPEELRKGLAFLKRSGWQPVLGEHVLSRNRYLAGGDSERAEDLMALFADPQVKAIFCARGGYGANRIIPHLNPRIIRNNPKIFVGASDITTLLLYLTQNISMVVFHGPMVAGSFGRHPMTRSKKQFRSILGGAAGAACLRHARAQVVTPGACRGPIAGGCLTLLCRSLGTPWEIRTRGRILIIEDVNEAPYRIDGLLWQLKQAGKFKGVKGVLLGEMIGCHPAKNKSWPLKEVVRDVFSGERFPVMMNLPLGHGKEMWTLPLGVEARMDTESQFLTLEDCGVV